jgi:chemotaxis response regulator CheB
MENQKEPQKIRVFCVDDSPIILKLLARTFKSDGFELVGVAASAEEAHERLSSLKVDVMTLDIYMPGMTGVEYLKNYYTPEHPAVLLVTSASSEEAEMIEEAKSIGAVDYIEKPSIERMEETTEDIKKKVREIYKNYNLKGNVSNANSQKEKVVKRIKVLCVDQIESRLEFFKYIFDQAPFDLLGSFSDRKIALAEIVENEPDMIIVNLDLSDDANVQYVKKVIGLVEKAQVVTTNTDFEFIDKVTGLRLIRIWPGVDEIYDLIENLKHRCQETFDSVIAKSKDEK